MRTNIEIDDKLMKQAMKASGLKTKKATVDEALRILLRVSAAERLRKLRGKLHWEGNLEESRLARGEEYVSAAPKGEAA